MNDNQGSELTVEELYIKEKKKSQVLMVMTVVLVIALVGSFAFSDSETTNTATTTPTFDQSQTRGGGLSVTSFFNADGSLDQETVDASLERAASRGGTSLLADRLGGQISSAVSSGEITEAQAAALEEALGL